MTKEEKERILLLKRFDNKHIQNFLKQKKVLDLIYDSLAKEAARIGKMSGFDDTDAEFHFEDYPQTLKLIDKLVADFADKIETTIQEGNKREWLLSNDKNTALITSLAASTGIDKKRIEGWTKPNLDALQAFQERKRNGMGLSDNVWKVGRQVRQELELALDIGLGEGKSAAALSRDVRKYLDKPDMLFRRVRDKHGNLRLSKAAEAFHPGQGTYRSSYKNALRMTATENNMAYRTADHEKWGNLDFIIGQKIQLSNNHTIKNSKGVAVPFHDICDEMVGDYPKDFKFTGWHPFCRCIVTPILADWNEVLENMDNPEHHYEGEITDMPEGYNKWMEKNADRIERAKSLPYFIKDNPQYTIDAIGGKNIADVIEKASILDYITDAKTTKELVEAMTNQGVTKVFDLGDMPLAEQKTVAEAWVKMKETFNLDAIDIRLKNFGAKNSNTFMWAHGRFVEANSRYWGKDALAETKSTTFNNCVTNRKKILEDRLSAKKKYLKTLQEEDSAMTDKDVKKWYAKEIKKIQKAVDTLQKQIDTGMSRHNVFLSSETMLRDCSTHEMGHTVHDQILGGLNGSAFRKKMYNEFNANVLDGELKALYKKHCKLGGGWLSEYGLTSHKEFMAESTVMYMYAPDKLPADVKAWFDLLKEYSKSGVLPAKEKMPSVVFKKTNKAVKRKSHVVINNKPNRIVVSNSQVDYEPYSDKINQRLQSVKGKDKRNKIFEAVIQDDRAKLINETDKAITTAFNEHRSMKGETWKNTKQMAIDLNYKGISVCFLPEHQSLTSADAIVQFKDSWRIADFKCSQSFKTNTLQIDMAKAFQQADCCVLKVMNADKGQLDAALDYLVRNGLHIGDLVVINKLGNVKIIECKHIQKGKYVQMLKGFL